MTQKIFILIILIVFGLRLAFSQDPSAPNHARDTITIANFKIKNQITSPIKYYGWSSDNYSNLHDFKISHYPTSEDKQLIAENADIINSIPTKSNYMTYYKVACAYFETNHIIEAEKMFLNIINSDDSFYSNTYRFASDIKRDKSTNLYGYGSYTFNYKNKACFYLSKIYIEKRLFDEAYKYLELAKSTYKVTYTCGTGSTQYEKNMEELYIHCDMGLKQYDKAVNMLLIDESFYNQDYLVQALMSIYTPKQVEMYLDTAFKSIHFIQDTFVTNTSQTHYSDDTSFVENLSYISGDATIYLFGKTIELQIPLLSDGDVLTREYFINEFIESKFYQSLLNYSKSTKSD